MARPRLVIAITPAHRVRGRVTDVSMIGGFFRGPLSTLSEPPHSII
jgi:hypothetical protein